MQVMPVIASNAGNTSKAGIMQVMQEKQVMWSIQVIQAVQVIWLIQDIKVKKVMQVRLVHMCRISSDMIHCLIKELRIWATPSQTIFNNCFPQQHCANYQTASSRCGKHQYFQKWHEGEKLQCLLKSSLLNGITSWGFFSSNQIHEWQ